MIKESDNIASRLMNGENDSAVIFPSERDQAFDNIKRVVRIQALEKSLNGSFS